MTAKNSATGKIIKPAYGEKITVNADNSLQVPKQPIIPFIEGNGIGADITPPMIKVVDAAVSKAYQGSKKIAWMEVYAGEKPPKFTVRTNGCRLKPWQPSVTTWYQLKAH